MNMKKKVLSIILALVMVVGMIPFAAIPAFAASGWQSYEVHGQYGYVKSGNDYYPLNSSSDFNSAFASGKTSYNIHLLSDYTADSLVLDAECLNIYLNGHNLTVTGDVEVDVYAGEGARDTTIFAVYGNGGSISFLNSTSTSAFTFGWSGYMGHDVITSFFDVTFLNCKGRVLDAESSGKLTLSITNCRFENCSADYGSCLYLNDGLITQAVIANCRFVNCLATDGGAVYVDDVGDEYSFVTFSDSYAVNCHASGDGGFMYVNDKDVKVYGSSNTVISDCSAGDRGGAVYMELGKTLDGFIFADNRAENGDGGGICNKSNSAAISNCRFYRNYAKVDGGGIYLDNGTVENCKFYDNDCGGDGYSLCAYWNETKINNCAFTSAYGENVVYNGTRSNCTFHDQSSYQLTVGDGSKENPYLIKSTDDWDALHYIALKRGRMYLDGTEYVIGDQYSLYGKYIRLDADITVCNTVGEVREVLYTVYSEFNGIFDGNGHTVTYVSNTGSDRNGVFGYANSATVKNLTVNGYVGGRSRVGGLFGSTYNCTAENCTNNATVYGTISSLGDTASFIGGIVGHSECSNYIGCINNGKIEGTHEHIGGIVGYSNGDTVNGCTNNGNVVCFQKCGGIVGTASGDAEILNCVNNGNVTANYNYAGGLIGYESSAVTVENCIVTGKASSIFGDTHFVNGDYIICSAQNGNICLNINDGSQSSYADLELRDKSTASANVFTLTYNAGTDDYTIKAKHSGLYLAPYYTMAYNPDEWYVVEQMESYTDSNQFRWKFENAGNGYVYIRSQYDNTQGSYLSALNSGTGNGTLIGVSKYKANALLLKISDLKGNVPRQIGADAITGYTVSGSTYENCFYNKEKTVASSFGTGLSDNAMNGLTADENGNLMPYCVNDNLKDGWLRAAFDDNKQLQFIQNGTPIAIGKHGFPYGFSGYPEAIVINNSNNPDVLGSAEKAVENDIPNKTTYIVTESVTHNGRIKIVGDVLLIICDGCEYTVNGGIELDTYTTSDKYSYDRQERTAALTVTSESLGNSMGKLTVKATNPGDAAIGGNVGSAEFDGGYGVNIDVHHGGKLNIFGGNIRAIGNADNSVGIGGGAGVRYEFYTNSDNIYCYPAGGNGSTVNMYNGSLDVTAGKDAVAIGGGKGFFVRDNEYGIEWNGNGGNGGTFNYYGGTVTAMSDVAAFGKGINGDGTNPDRTAAQNNNRIKTDKDAFIHYGDSEDSTATIWYKEENDTEKLNQNKYGMVTDHPEHRYIIKYRWADDCSTCTALYACEICSDDYPGNTVKSETVGTTSVHYDATCTEADKTVYTSGEFTDPDFIRQTKTVYVGETAPGHNVARDAEYDPQSREYIVADFCQNCDYRCNEQRYTAYDYIAAEKGAYINTGYEPNWYTRIVMDINVCGSYECWFGCECYHAHDYVNDFTLGNNGTEMSGSVNDCKISGPLVPNGYHKVELDDSKGKVLIDGVISTTYDYNHSFYINQPLYLFALNKGGSLYVPDGQGTICCYGCEIYKGNGDLVRKFVPVKNSDGVSGLLDIVNGVFYGNSGSASMTARNDTVHTVSQKNPTCTENGHIAYYFFKSVNYSDKACTKEITDLFAWLNTTVENGGGMIPATGHDCECSASYDDASGDYIITEKCKNCDYTNEYTITEYNYIAAEKGAYIDTGIKPTDKTRVVMDVYVNGGREYWFGAWDTDWNRDVFALGNDKNGEYSEIYAGYGNQGGGLGDGSLVSNGYHTVELDEGAVKIDGTAVKQYNTEDFSLDNPLYLFAQNRAGSATAYADQSTIHCYGCEIYEDGTLVRKFVPFGNNEGVAGFMDVVNGVFYGNSGNAQMTALNDTHTIIEQINPRCTNIGRSAYYITRLGIFADENHTKKISDLQSWRNTPVAEGGGLIPALGHSWEYLDTQKHKCSVCKAEEAHSHNGLGNCAECGASVYTVTLVNTETSETVYSGNIDCTNGCIIESIANGTYIMTVSCAGMVARTYPIEVTDGRVDETVTLSIEGDVNGDGEITVEDYSAAVNTALKNDNAVPSDLSETNDYQKAVADLDKDGYVDVLDIALLERKIHI